MSIGGRKPRVLGAGAARLRLSREERVVLARIDGQLSVSDIAGMTGFEQGQLEQMMEKLALEGAIDFSDVPAAPPSEPSAPTLRRPKIRPRRPDPPESAPGLVALPSLDSEPDLLSPEPEVVGDVAPLPDPELLPQAVVPPFPDTERDLPPASGSDPTMAEVDAPEDSTPVLDEVVVEAGEEGQTLSKEEIEKDEVSRGDAERNYRKIYETRWHNMLPDQRAAGARTAHGPDLFALCFDPDPQVIAAVLENATTGLDHVRLIAFHHRTTTGLEILARRREWLRDTLIERRLLRNPMIGEIVLNRVMAPKRLFPTYKIAIDRDIPELTRVKCRGLIRQKWQTATSEERSDLLIRTEARCLIIMTGCTFDAKTTAILCGRPINSAMFVQSISKFAASPPGLLAHLMKQPFVRKNHALRKMLLQHPNMPGDVKRNI